MLAVRLLQPTKHDDLTRKVREHKQDFGTSEAETRRLNLDVEAQKLGTGKTTNLKIALAGQPSLRRAPGRSSL